MMLILYQIRHGFFGGGKVHGHPCHPPSYAYDQGIGEEAMNT